MNACDRFCICGRRLEIGEEALCPCCQAGRRLSQKRGLQLVVVGGLVVIGVAAVVARFRA